jgi:peptide/nickel transport system permease protein
MRVLRDLFRDYRFAISFAIVSLLALFAIISFFAPDDPTLWNSFQRDLPPSKENWLGTDSRGIDIFWTAALAVRNSLTVAVIAGIISRLITVPVAMLSGYKGGITDRILMFVSDSFLVFPLFMIIILLAVMLRDLMNLFTLGLLLACFGWAWDARVIRSEILSLREQGFTQTAVLSGTGTLRLVLKEYMPFVTPLVFATAGLVVRRTPHVHHGQRQRARRHPHRSNQHGADLGLSGAGVHCRFPPDAHG